MKQLKKINVLQFAKFQSILIAMVGVICGIVYSFGGLLVDILVTMNFLSEESMSTSGISLGTLLAFAALVGMPLIFGVMGYILGIVEAILFNLFAPWFGGIKTNFIID